MTKKIENSQDGWLNWIGKTSLTIVVASSATGVNLANCVSLSAAAYSGYAIYQNRDTIIQGYKSIQGCFRWYGNQAYDVASTIYSGARTTSKFLYEQAQAVGSYLTDAYCAYTQQAEVTHL